MYQIQHCIVSVKQLCIKTINRYEIVYQIIDPNYLSQFEVVIHCGNHSEMGLSKYAIRRVYDRLISRLHHQIGLEVYE